MAEYVKKTPFSLHIHPICKGISTSFKGSPNPSALWRCSNPPQQSSSSTPGRPCGMPPAVSARRNGLTCPIQMAKPRAGCGDTAPGLADRRANKSGTRSKSLQSFFVLSRDIKIDGAGPPALSSRLRKDLAADHPGLLQMGYDVGTLTTV